MRNVNSLVVVAGHATYLDSVEHVPDDPSQENLWYLQRFQKGEVPFYINHMRRGAELVAEDPSSLGLMSGGHTRPESRRWSEAGSYLETARRYGFWQHSAEAMADVNDRFGEEEFARDSLENVLFSVMRYRRAVGSMPLRLIMVGWEVKEQRSKHHAETLGIPEGTFEYEGVPFDAYGCTATPPDMDTFGAAEMRTLDLWNADPLGSSADGELLQKRNGRNPFGISPPYALAEYVGYAHEAGWQPSRDVLAAAALVGSSA